MKLVVGQEFPYRVLTSIEGREIVVPDRTRWTHLQFRRFVGCPICATHLGHLRRRANDIRDAGIREVLFFHSTAKEIRDYQADLPFELVADPKKIVYQAVGAERSPFYVMHPKAFWAALRGMSLSRLPKVTGGPGGLPADILVDPSGRVHAVKYGRHAYDQWSVNELLALVRSTALHPETRINH